MKTQNQIEYIELELLAIEDKLNEIPENETKQIKELLAKKHILEWRMKQINPLYSK